MKCSSIYRFQVEDRNGIAFEVGWVYDCWFPKIRQLERRDDKRGSGTVRGGHWDQVLEDAWVRKGLVIYTTPSRSRWR